MLFSFFVAMVVAPWLMLRLAPKQGAAVTAHAAHDEGVLGRLYRRFATPIVRSKRASWIFLLGVGVATLLSMTLFATKSVTVKLLPFDNKSEIAVVVDLPEGASLEDTERVLFCGGRHRARIARDHLGAVLCRHASAVQLQRPGTALLSARTARTRRIAGQPRRARQPQPGEP